MWGLQFVSYLYIIVKDKLLRTSAPVEIDTSSTMLRTTTVVGMSGILVNNANNAVTKSVTW